MNMPAGVLSKLKDPSLFRQQAYVNGGEQSGKFFRKMQGG